MNELYDHILVLEERLEELESERIVINRHHPKEVIQELTERVSDLERAIYGSPPPISFVD